MPDLNWGLLERTGGTVAWGARAIWNRPSDYPDVPHDRQCIVQTHEARDRAFARLANWINSTGMPKLRKLLSERAIDGSSDETVQVDDSREGFFICASPKQSYGYLYITAGDYALH